MAAFSAVALAALRKVWSAWRVQAQAVAKLNAVLKATGNAAGFSSREIQKQAAELQKLTGIGDELIISMQGVLASFTKISGQQFKRATVAILDMATVMQKAGQEQGRIEEGAVQVGKALNDPIRGMSALTRVGVVFSKSQRTLVQYFQETNRLAKAQDIILKELEGEFGGAAKNINETVKAGDLLRATFGDMLERIGEVIFETSEFSGIIDTARRAIEELTDSGAIEVWAEGVVAALAKIEKSIKNIAPILRLLPVISRGARFVGGLVGAQAGGLRGAEALDVALDVADPEQTKRDLDARRKAAREERDARIEAQDAEREAQRKRDAEAKAARKKEADALAAKLAADMERHKKRKALVKEIEKIEEKIADVRKSAAAADAKRLEMARLTSRIEHLKARAAAILLKDRPETQAQEFAGYQTRRKQFRKDEAEEFKFQKRIASIRRKLKDPITSFSDLSPQDRKFVREFTEFQKAQTKASDLLQKAKDLQQDMRNIQNGQFLELLRIRVLLKRNLEAA